jgi:hypothetical protein
MNETASFAVRDGNGTITASKSSAEKAFIPSWDF